MITILDLHEAHRQLGRFLPAEAHGAAGALLVVGQSRGEGGVDTWTWPRDPQSPAGYTRATLGGYAGGVGPESIRRGMRLLESLGMVKTQHRNWLAPRYTLIPQAWLDLARQARQTPAELLARVEALTRSETRKTVLRTLGHMTARLSHVLDRAMAYLSPTAHADVTPGASSPADVTPDSIPRWVADWAKRKKVDPAKAWAAAEPALIILAPKQHPEGQGSLGQAILARWLARDCPSGMELGAEVGLLLSAVRARVPGFDSIQNRIARRGHAALLRSTAYDDLVAVAQAWRDAEGAPALPTAPKAGASGLTRSQAFDQAIAELGLDPAADGLSSDQITQLDRRIDELLAVQGPAPPS